MKILFTYITHPVEPLGIMYLSSYLKQYGHETKLVRIDQENVVEVVSNFKPDVIASQAMTGGHLDTIEFFRKLKQKFEFISVMGGSHPTFYPKVIEEEGVDVCIQGEAEDALADLMNALEKGEDYTKIQNLLVKKDGKVYYNQMRHLREDVDNIPFPDRDIAYEHEIWRKQPIRHFIACRGCAYRCTYCFNNTIAKIYEGKGNWVRWRKIDLIIKEIKEVFDKYGGKFVYFQDDIFIMNKPWLQEFAEKYKKGIGIPFHCHVRPNLVDDKSADLLSKAGCFSVHMALETANDDLRNSILQRNMPKETVYEAANNLHRHGIKIMLQNMVGLPGSTLKDDLETLKMNMKIKPLYAWVSIFQPYPGLELTEYAAKHGYLDIDFDKIDKKFFENSVLKIEKIRQREHLQKWFGIAAEHPIFYYSGLLHLIINMPRNSVVKKAYIWAWKKFRDYKDSQLYGLQLA